MSSEAADHPTDDAGEPAIGVVAMHDGADPSAAPVGEAGPVQAADIPFPQAEATPPADTPSPQAEATPPADTPSPQAEATPPADTPSPQAEATPPADTPSPQAPAAPRARRAKPRSRRGGRPQVPRDLPRSRAALPLDELRDASRSTLDLFGRQAVREAFGILAQRERRDLSDLIARDEDHRPRARNIANGSLGAGRIDKAMSATIVAMARHEDLWSVALDKELAAEKLGRVRAAKQRDQRRVERARDRDQRADRVSRADLQKAQDGRVGATIRIVTEDDRRGRRGRSRGEQESTARNSVLDRLGY